MRGSDFNGWVPPEFAIMAGIIVVLAILLMGFVGYHVGGYLWEHLRITWG